MMYKKYLRERFLRKLWMWTAIQCVAGVVLMAVLGVII